MQHEEYSVEVNVQCGCFQCLTGAQVTALRAVFLHEAPPPLTETQAGPRITHTLLIHAS